MVGFPKSWLWASLWILVPLFFYMSLGCSTLPKLDSKTVVELTPFLFGYMCTAADKRFAKEHLHYGYCDSGVWIYNDSDPCVTITFQPCSGDPTLRARENITSKIKKDPDRYIGAVLNCVDGYAWLSGHSVRVSECVDGSWTTVYDLCSVACEVDKDCSKIAVNQTETRIISPNGNTLKAVMAECRENTCGKALNKPYSWTLIGRRNMTGMDANYSAEVTANMKAASLGDRLTTGKQYFIGTYNLGSMSRDSAGNPLPQVLRIEMTVAGQSSPLHITYFGVTFDLEGGVNLTSNYHGNLENCWKGRTVVSLLPNDTQCNLFGDKLIKWGTVTPLSVLMYVTPVQMDQEATCPALNIMDVAWTNAIATVPLERCPGSVVSFSCIGQYMVEGTTLEASGLAECLSNRTWSTTPQFPCKMKCPEGYNLSAAQDYCFKTPTTPLSEGLKSASKICSGLFWIHSQADFSNVPDDGSFYYTAQVGKEATAVIGNLTTWNIRCDGSSCQVMEDVRCLVVSRSKYKIVYCGDTSVKALCRTPASCPENYAPLNSYCYRVINSSAVTSDFFAATQTCSADTASLAYPETQEELDFIEDLVSGSSAQPVKRVLLGIHDANGNWTAGGFYAPTSDILTAVGTTNATQHWRYLEVSTTSSSLPMAYSTSMTSSSSITSTFIGTHYTGTAELAVCRYPDYIGTACRTQPRQPTENMKPPAWKSVYAMGDAMSYSCYPGYFFNGNITASPTYNMTCLGRLGEWYSDLEFPQCLVANVCLSALPMLPTVGMVTAETNTSRFLNGTVTFTCPPQMAIANGSKTQNITCMTPDNSTYSFAPSVLQKCYMFCWDAPVVENATTTWLGNLSYIEGSNVSATCVPGHQFTPGNVTQTVNCTTNGTWQGLPCYPACVDPRPEPLSFFMEKDPSPGKRLRDHPQLHVQPWILRSRHCGKSCGDEYRSGEM
ncbi:uncharacterized protein LOC135203223 isoform X2 [Macrobrachium nipponense]|uniref:uncharacterized protein LOC135203223 isoform X2 n=1 Tax=Macrobrachium nipponense TaxID=159736 RepID=UPI0030C7C709